MRYGWLAGLLLTLPAAASDFGARYPAGSILDVATAQAALKDADAEMAAIARRAQARDAECYRRFFVNSCRDDVRREKELASAKSGACASKPAICSVESTLSRSPSGALRRRRRGQ